MLYITVIVTAGVYLHLAQNFYSFCDFHTEQNHVFPSYLTEFEMKLDTSGASRL